MSENTNNHITFKIKQSLENNQYKQLLNNLLLGKKEYHFVAVKTTNKINLLAKSEINCLNNIAHTSKDLALVSEIKANRSEHTTIIASTIFDKSWINSWKEKIDEIMKIDIAQRFFIQNVISKKNVIKNKSINQQNVLKINKQLRQLLYDISSKEETTINELDGFVFTKKDLDLLLNNKWLNDEIINYYLSMIQKRSEHNKDVPKVHCFNTFFYLKCQNAGVNSIAKWVRKIDFPKLDILIVPVHSEVHWFLATIDIRNKAISYYDSLNGTYEECIETMKTIVATYIDKTNMYSIYIDKEIPQQKNGYDCGVFLCVFAEYLSRYSEFDFDQEDMVYFRRKISYEIITQKFANE